MKVKLLKTVLEEGRVKASIRLPRSVRGFDESGKPTVTAEEREPVAFVKGAVIEMGQASAQKYIDKGWAEPVTEAAETR